MKQVLDILLGNQPQRQEADNSLFLSRRNYLGVEPKAEDVPNIEEPPVQVGSVAGLVTVIDNGTIIKLAPGEEYDGGIRIL